MPDLKKLMEENQERCDLLIELGLPGSLGFGYRPVPGGGKLRTIMDPLTIVLVEKLVQAQLELIIVTRGDAEPNEPKVH